MRVGIGIDVHQFVENRKLIIGGIEIPHTMGLKGHSDADVLLHAISDALLGAAALGDIGKHFPDTSPDFKDIDSRILLRHVGKLIADEGYTIVNIDSMLLMERPKVAPYIVAMRESIAECLDIETSRVSVKATTNEKLGYIGRQEGAAAHAVCLIEEK
ncbi:MAG: 2-C-methyl-D-erythritol 2,4-cyclodiphosphate synthase [Prosthecochloris sp.]|uniref:2-C-methyl-D-erythritol 2,4-cyclodiphosphate synthase n=1 Tax=Prosthecochloris aestuarii (strain DSM 271 / SK 413) TaxID=290512 RepID=ISPF_PROA2|nr:MULTISPECIES: 2-C-methyl-D-erythritol 2,4-cyclodiphosphate synthase [Prosthecochloris]B4S5L1.1 RecName: Full=2-C-methyl-D-erythritol 2,4-cyclodiphosphate synthase; Short=MECDP-synthase; Short=MECPP-synthase; Short=MECPS [Prosthecochloris aestuarii DSM 271]ACF45608.1 2C-methyl-D-erythritol 2,4-cyclodiphosphate synthase [Prosthecochloris aestuarii DSM 271]MCW8797523.1 2-C-methyl-D-erythritol 2,4-cyclodiphosphate synthase [Prosthecochloris sp.]NEX11609.1 2-C-methyl-D-erythritol 2,4-cyclodiphosp